MQNLKDKVKALGYKEIKDIDDNTFIGVNKGNSIFVKWYLWNGH
jgi:type I restriction enzyme M protein